MSKGAPKSAMLSVSAIENRIFEVRGHRVMLDADLAKMYAVETGALNQAVERNLERFPADFMFRLTRDEVENLKSQSVISRSAWGGRRRSTPRAFTEQGVAMLSSVLRSKRAIMVNVAIMRAFVRIREVLSAHGEMIRKLDALEERVGTHDHQIKTIFNALRQLIATPVRPKRKIGF